MPAGLLLHPAPSTHPPTQSPCPQAELADIDSYLESMGVRDARLRQRLEAQVPFADAGALGAGAADARVPPVAPLSAAARGAATSGAASAAGGLPTLLVCCDAGGGLGGLEPVLSALGMPVYAVCLPEGDVEDAPADVAELATLALKAARGVVPPGGRLVVAGARRGGRQRWMRSSPRGLRGLR